MRYFYRIFEELFYPLMEKRNNFITFVGDRDTYRALQSFLRIKEGPGYRIRNYISADNLDLSELRDRGNDTGIFVIEDKYKELLDRMDDESKGNLELSSLSEFMSSRLAGPT